MPNSLVHIELLCNLRDDLWETDANLNHLYCCVTQSIQKQRGKRATECHAHQCSCHWRGAHCLEWERWLSSVLTSTLYWCIHSWCSCPLYPLPLWITSTLYLYYGVCAYHIGTQPLTRKSWGSMCIRNQNFLNCILCNSPRKVQGSTR